MIAVFGGRRPAGEERPHGAVVVAIGAVFRILIGNNSHAPIGLVIGSCESREGGFGFCFVEQAEPHGHGR